MVEHGYPWLFHGHLLLFHTHGQECNHSATKTWLNIAIIMVITSFLLVNHWFLKKEYNGRPLQAILSKATMWGYGSNMSFKILDTMVEHWKKLLVVFGNMVDHGWNVENLEKCKIRILCFYGRPLVTHSLKNTMSGYGYNIILTSLIQFSSSGSSLILERIHSCEHYYKKR